MKKRQVNPLAIDVDRPIVVTHWGTYRVEVTNGKIRNPQPIETDKYPSEIGDNLFSTLKNKNRIKCPMIRAGYLKKRSQADRSTRGIEPFVPVSWEEAFSIVAEELKRVKLSGGNESIYGGSYGWASPGRFHHAQSQVHRFLNMYGGYTSSVNTYSTAAGEVILPHVIGSLERIIKSEMTSWPSIIDNTKIMLCFGGLPIKNAQIANGGTGCHIQKDYMLEAKRKGVKFISISPVKSDADPEIGAERVWALPNTDVPIMLAIAHTLIAEKLYDNEFLSQYCVGFENFKGYVLGRTDGIPKTPVWAEELSKVPANIISGLAQEMSRQRTMISVSWSLTRQDHGEQPYWMAVVLAAMLGQIGLPGGGVGFGYAAANSLGNSVRSIKWDALPQGENPVETWIPVSRIGDMLLAPHTNYDFNGQKRRFPHIRMIYWAGGNPFHHHQDLNRFMKALNQVETIIVHEQWWNAMAKHSDIVLPSTTTLERNDLSCGPFDRFVFPMKKIVEAIGDARSDYEIFSGIAGELGTREQFTENKDEMDWIREIYDASRVNANDAGIELPAFDKFWKGDGIEIPPPDIPNVMLEQFRHEHERYPLSTPSGKIEIFSETINSFGYPDCPGHPTWLPPREWLGADLAKTYPLHLISNQPKTKLHSQLDHGSVSLKYKIKRHEVIMINPKDMKARGIRDGDVVRVFNERGQILAGAQAAETVMERVVQMATGAWYDPLEPGKEGTICKHGNVNILTPDRGTSSLAQGCSAQSCLVQIELYDGPEPEVTAHSVPLILNDQVP